LPAGALFGSARGVCILWLVRFCHSVALGKCCHIVSGPAGRSNDFPPINVPALSGSGAAGASGPEPRQRFQHEADSIHVLTGLQ